MNLGFGTAEAIAAIYRATVAGFKWHLCFPATSRTDCGEHLARGAGFLTADALLFCLTANRAALGIVGEAFLSVEFLLGNRKRECFAAIGTT
jgi:hypothetical protein